MNPPTIPVYVGDGIVYLKKTFGVKQLPDGTFRRENGDRVQYGGKNGALIDARALGAIPLKTEQSEPKVYKFNVDHVIAVGCKVHLFEMVDGLAVEVKTPLDISGEITGNPESGGKPAKMWCTAGNKIASLYYWEVQVTEVPYTEVITGSCVFVARYDGFTSIIFGNSAHPEPIRHTNCTYLLVYHTGGRSPTYEIILNDIDTGARTSYEFKPDGELVTSNTPEKYEVGGVADAMRHISPVSTLSKILIKKHILRVDKISYLAKLWVVTYSCDVHYGQWGSREWFNGTDIITCLNMALRCVGGYDIQLDKIDGIGTLVLTHSTRRLDSYRPRNIPVMPCETAQPATSCEVVTNPPPKFEMAVIGNNAILNCTFGGEQFTHTMLLGEDPQMRKNMLDFLVAVVDGDPEYEVDAVEFFGNLNVSIKNGPDKWSFIMFGVTIA